MIKIVDGDILNAKENLIGHQVNCLGFMGTGLARQVKRKHMYVFGQYIKLISEENTIYGTSKELLGLNQYVQVDNKKYIVNMFGQYDINEHGEREVKTDLSALRKCLKELRERAEKYSLSVALPYKLGSDRGGAEWNDVLKIIEEEFNGYDKITLYRLNK